MSPAPFVTTEWLAANLHSPSIALVDASWYMPAAKRDPAGEFLQSHLPGAVFFDIDGVADKTTDLPHMLPTPEDFARMVGALGIGSDQTIVVYDESGLFSAPRALWTFRTMGARDVRILEGGGAKWRAEGRPLESGEPKIEPRVFTPHFHPENVRSIAQMRDNLETRARKVLDARPAGRFAGTEPEPRAGIRSGHIPGSGNVPVGLLTENGLLKPAADLKALFAERGVELSQPITTSCGSGITASTLALALEVAGAKDVSVYDGSWTEWGGDASTPVEK